MNQPADKTATLYRMVMPTRTCPYGMKALHLLRSKGYRVSDHWLGTEAETEAFKAGHGVKTTPQIFMGGQRIGGYDDLRRHLGKKVADPTQPSYRPVIAVFTVAFLMAAACLVATGRPLFSGRLIAWFVAFSMCILALLKLQDLERFSSMFLGYDLLARRYVPYAYAYPFAELTAGVLMISGRWGMLSGLLALFIGGIGAVSVYKAVYLERRSLKCACVGGNTNVPLGPVSLAENLLMVLMGLWMLFR